MKFKHFKIQLSIRILAMVIIIIIGTYYTMVQFHYIRLFFLIIALILLIGNLFFYINKTNRDLTQFVQAIINKDYTTTFNQKAKGRSFNEFYEALNRVNATLKELNKEREGEYQYLNTLVQQINVAILAFDKTGHIHLCNETLYSLLNKKNFSNILEIKSINQVFYQAITEVKAGQSSVIRIQNGFGVQQLSINASQFRLKNKSYTLVTCQDIKAVLDYNEMQAWQKLIRVLTHEIMNSVAPITSLSSSLNLLIKDKKSSDLSTKDIANLNVGLMAIENRSTGLSNFAKSYRSLTKLPKPNLIDIPTDQFIEGMQSLLTPTLNKSGISFESTVVSGVPNLIIDQDLMSQVIINLVKNAQEAILENNINNGKIALSVHKDPEGRINIIVSDNGGGIEDQHLDELFIPFFTTKPSGSGIGLSLAKQIIDLHGGTLNFTSSIVDGWTQCIIIL